MIPRVLDGQRHLLAHGGAHAAHEEQRVQHGEHRRVAVDPARRRHHGLLHAGLLALCRQLLFIAGERERIAADELRVHLLKRARIAQRRQPVPRGNHLMRAAGRAHAQALTPNSLRHLMSAGRAGHHRLRRPVH